MLLKAKVKKPFVKSGQAYKKGQTISNLKKFDYKRLIQDGWIETIKEDKKLKIDIETK